jgi:hypothetical protein
MQFAAHVLRAEIIADHLLPGANAPTQSINLVVLDQKN